MAIRQGLGVYGDMSGDDSEWKAREPFPGTLSLLAFPSTTVQIQTSEALRARQADARPPQFTCFTSTTVQILTPEALRDRQERDTRQHGVSAGQGFGEAGATFCLHVY
jgi:hypothetical protein